MVRDAILSVGGILDPKQFGPGTLDEASLLDHIVRLGRQTAYERMAHLLLELRWRLAEVGLGDERKFPLPLTQEVLADALGLSIVHVNRTLQQLRREGLLEMRAGFVELLKPDVLIATSDFRLPQPTRQEDWRAADQGTGLRPIA